MPAHSVDCVIQRATPEHANALIPLMHELGYDTSLATIDTQLSHYDTSEHSIVFVALIGFDVVGLIDGHLIPALHQPGDIGRITALIVAEKARSRGIGSRLVQELESWFLSKRCLRFEVTSGEHRDSAHRFYESLGYAPSSRRFLKLP
jgi:GNAT superfamily N-acetyltransferase